MAKAETAAGEAAKSTMEHFVIDSRASRFTVRATATGILSAMGHNPTIGVREFTGNVDFDPHQALAEHFTIAINARSLAVTDDISSKDRKEMERVMNQDLLESERFPEILYEASSIFVTRLGDSLYSVAMKGSLTLHGVTLSEPIPARVVWMESMVRASGEFTVSQSRYQMKPVSVAGGALKLKDELKCQFEIVARRQE
jgi:polyisoprenoid-binding protein YceI